MFKYSLTIVMICLLVFVLSNDTGSRKRKPKTISFNSDNDDFEVSIKKCKT